MNQAHRSGSQGLTTLIHLATLLANIGVLAINVKLCTEYFKDRSIQLSRKS